MKQQSLRARKIAMQKALLQYSKQKFSEMQSSYQKQETPETTESVLAAPISPTPNNIIESFLPYLNLGSDSLLVDLGCGDGRWLISAAKMAPRCRCIGIDVDEQRLLLANQSIEKEELGQYVSTQNKDVFEFIETDHEYFSEMNVLIMYLFRDAMLRIGNLLKQRSGELRHGVKILCVGFALPQWKAIRTEKICGLSVYLYENVT